MQCYVNYGHFWTACHLYTNIKFYTLFAVKYGHFCTACNLYLYRYKILWILYTGCVVNYMGIFALLAICTYTDIKFYEFYTQAVLLTMGIFALLAKSCFVAMAAPADGKLCLWAQQAQLFYVRREQTQLLWAQQAQERSSRILYCWN